MDYNPLIEYALEEIVKRGYTINTPWDAVNIFEKKIAEYAGSKFAIAVDNCSDAIFLCLKYLKAQGEITIPARTYISIPSMILNSGCNVLFEDFEWSGAYQLKPYPIYDSALRFTKDMYIKDSYQCLSFHRKKIFKLIKGGMILTDDEKAANWFKKARAKGRHPHLNILYENEQIDMLGWNMYMPPEHAAQGILIFDNMEKINMDSGGSKSYVDLRQHPIFRGNINE
jgi:dTDP-4-amino-4,6-dideoxygalactose transaminase